jgi:hypothetical protein
MILIFRSWSELKKDISNFNYNCNERPIKLTGLIRFLLAGAIGLVPKSQIE